VVRLGWYALHYVSSALRADKIVCTNYRAGNKLGKLEEEIGFSGARPSAITE
jgi:hypothetical protein